jgi:hypothetical protein
MRERFNTIAVALPAQQFHVRCHVSIERQVPVMTDFAVRLLHLSGTLEVRALREYFGLTGKEVIDLLNLLSSEGLVEESAGRISLTSYAEARFVASSDDLPRFTRIMERQSRPIFELLSYSPISKNLSGTYWDNTLELDLSSESGGLGQTVDRAQTAFYDHFNDIERLEQDDEHRRAFSCYKVDSIVSGRPFNIPLPVNFEVDVDGNVEFDVDGQLDLLPDELRSRVRRLTADRVGALPSHADHLKGFVSFFEDSLLARYLEESSISGSTSTNVARSGHTLVLRKPPDFNFSAYIRDVHADADGEVYDGGQSKALLGALYMPKIQDRLLELMTVAVQRFKRAATTETSYPPEIIWVIPDTELWGRTVLVRQLVERFSTAVGKVWGEPVEVVGIAPMAQNEPMERVRKRGNLLLDAGFKGVYLGPTMLAHERFESVLLPGVFGAAMYQWKVPSMNVLSVPIGFASQEPEKLRRIAAFTRNACAGAMHHIWRGSGRDGEDRKLRHSSAMVADFLYLEAFSKSLS